MRRPLRTSRALGLGFALGLFCACAPSGSSPSAALSPSAEPAASPGPNALAFGIVESMFQAPRTISYAGARRVEFHYDSAGTPHTLAYQERVTTDGRGRFAIDPGRVESPSLAGPELEIFELIQKEREGFFHRYRDFGIRARELFHANYSVRTLPGTPTVAGRACTEIEVRRQDQTHGTYVVALDTATGIVLRYSEFGPNGELLARGEFLDFVVDPPTAGVEFFHERYPRALLDPLHESEADVGFRAAQPHFLPAGYQILRSELVQESGRKWVVRSFGDGVESLFFVHGGPKSVEAGATVPTTARPNSTGQAPVVAVSSTQVTPEVLTIRVCQVGQWTMAEVVRGGENLFVVGKVGEADVVRVLRSSL